MQTLSTERLHLLKLGLEDAPFVLKLVNSQGWLQYIGDRNIHTIEAAEDYIKTGPWKSFDQFGFGLMKAVLPEKDTPIGMCGLLQRDFLDHPDIGFAFLPEYEGKGYAYEASKAILGHFGSKHNIPVILAMTHPGNERSQNLLTRLGFTFSKQFAVNNGSLSNLYTLSTTSL